MNERIGSLRAELAETSDDLVTAELVRLINENIKPLQTVSAEDVCIRSMYIVSDQVNSYGGRFPAEEHDRLAALLVDSPVMVGHRKDSLPIGRNFHAVTVEKGGRPWVRSYFYWLNSAEGAETLRENIDKGVYKECSIGFTYLLPECSVCGEDIRRCRHSLFQAYVNQGTEQTCHFNYRQVQKVLETSLVYRGAIPDTSISKDLEAAPETPRQIPRTATLPVLQNLLDFESDSTCMVVPHYEGIPVVVEGAEGAAQVREVGGDLLEVHGLAEIRSMAFPEGGVSGKLVGYRGKERCSVHQLRSFLAGGSGPVTRALLYLYPDDRLTLANSESRPSAIKLFRHRFVNGRQLGDVAGDVSTKSGVEIWKVAADGSLVAGVRFVPPIDRPINTAESFGLRIASESSSGEIRVRHKRGEECFVVHNFNLNRLHHGAHFLAARVDTLSPASDMSILAGASVHRTASGGWRLPFNSPKAGELRLQPIRLHGRNRYLAYLTAGAR